MKSTKRDVINIQGSMSDVRRSRLLVRLGGLTASAGRILEQYMGYKVKLLAAEEAQAT
jgi:hypothetical protein